MKTCHIPIHKPRTLLFSAIMIAVLTATTVRIFAATGDVISVQLANTNSAIGGYQPLGPAESTGVLPATNWNFLAVDTPYSSDYGNFDPRSALWTPQTFALKDQGGVAGGVTLTILGASDAWRHENPNSSVGPNHLHPRWQLASSVSTTRRRL